MYLLGKQFTLVTDHKPLEQLGIVHTKTLNRLQHQMLTYDFTVQYRPGESNVVADYLSRTTAQDEEEEKDLTVATLSTILPDVEGKQLKDPLMKDIIQYLRTGALTRGTTKEYAFRIKRLADASFLDEKDRLWYKTEGNTRDKVALWTPKEARAELI